MNCRPYIRPEVMKLLKENMEGKLHDIGFSNDSLEMTPKVEAKKIDKWDHTKLEHFCTAKEIKQSKHERGKLQKRRKYLQTM